MKAPLRVPFVVTALLGLAVATTSAHPASDIVVNKDGEVFFVHTGRGVGKIDREGKLTYIHISKGGHWMCLDVTGSFSRAQPKYFERIMSWNTAMPTRATAAAGSHAFGSLAWMARSQRS